LTSFITIPGQDLRHGKLIYEIKAGRVGNIFLSPVSDGYLTLSGKLTNFDAILAGNAISLAISKLENFATVAGF
jgi:hypothetical protein